MLLKPWSNPTAPPANPDLRAYKMVDPGARHCAFCGSTGPLTREHVLGNWLSKIGLGDGSVENHAGPLNRMPVPMGVGAPFQQK